MIIFCFYFLKMQKKPHKNKNPGIIPLCWFSHSAVCKPEMVGRQAAGSFCKAGSAGHHPVPMNRGSTGLMSRHPCSSKKPAEGSAFVEADTGLNYSPQALLKITRSFRMQDLLVPLQAASCLSLFYPCLMFS